MDTIFAQATGRGKAGVSIIRVSGSEAFRVCERLAGFRPLGRGSRLRKIEDLDGGQIDQALVLWFSAGASFTGEDVVEFHLHGSPAVVSRTLEVLAGHRGLRMADPGEFTRRALENGCLDLSQVEGLADLIEAETEAQRQQALRVFEGALGEKVAIWRKALVRAASLIEVTIDFADEDVPDDVTKDVRGLISKVCDDLKKEAGQVQFAERVRDGFEVVILGPPNIGKSTLLNRLAGRQAAITSELAGTTRDVIEVRMDVQGFPVTFVDTAGLREAEGAIEAVGIDIARERAKSADLRIILINGDLKADFGIELRENDLVFQGKADTVETRGLAISGKTGEGVDELVHMVTERLGLLSSTPGAAIRTRHRQVIERAVESLTSALVRLEGETVVYEIVAEDLRQAVQSLEELIGRVDVESLLDEIFSSFCLGK